MRLIYTCLVTDDVPKLAGFYRTVLRVNCEGDQEHMAFQMDGAGLIIYSRGAASRQMGIDFPGGNESSDTIIGFMVDDVDEEYIRLKSLAVNFASVPKTYPWGARSVHFYDPDGNLVAFVSHQTAI